MRGLRVANEAVEGLMVNLNDKNDLDEEEAGGGYGRNCSGNECSDAMWHV